MSQSHYFHAGVPAGVAPELFRLAEDLTLVRDFGAEEAARCEARDFIASYYRDRPDIDNDLLATMIFGAFARVEGLLQVARTRGMLA